MSRKGATKEREGGGGGKKMATERKTMIKLTEEEEKVFEVLKNVAGEMKARPTLRAAGGWVRDKMLGRKSGDIDIALDTVTGAEFAEAVKEYLSRKEGTESHVAVIRSNPEQSKHLETATMKIFGFFPFFFFFSLFSTIKQQQQTKKNRTSN